MSLSDKYPYDPQNPRADLVLPPERYEPLNSARLICWLVFIWLFFFLACVLYTPIRCWLNVPVLVELTTGLHLALMCSQVGLLAIGAVLGPGKVAVRQLIVALIGISWMSALVFGHYLPHWLNVEMYELPNVKEFRGFLGLPFFICVCQAPLWLLRGLLGWHVERGSIFRSSENHPEISLLGILSATAVIACTLSLLRLEASFLDGGVRRWWLATAVTTAVVAGISQVTLPTVTWCILGWRSPLLGTLCCSTIIAGALLSLLIILHLKDRNWPESEQILMFGILSIGFIAGLIAPLLLVRRAGYRLHWRKELFQ